MLLPPLEAYPVLVSLITSMTMSIEYCTTMTPILIDYEIYNDSPQGYALYNTIYKLYTTICMCMCMYILVYTV